MSKLLSKASLAFALIVLIFGAPAGIASAPTAQAQTTPSVSQITSDALSCNCYSYVRSLIPGFPPTWELKANTTPHVGAVAIFNYNGLPHYGVITKLQDDGFVIEDSNFAHCKYMTHLILWGDSHIVGFWSS